MLPHGRLSSSQKHCEESASCFAKDFGNLATGGRWGKASGFEGCKALLVEIWVPGQGNLCMQCILCTVVAPGNLVEWSL